MGYESLNILRSYKTNKNDIVLTSDDLEKLNDEELLNLKNKLLEELKNENN